MNHRRLCYIVGPFAGQGETPAARKAQEAINVNRACFVGHILWKYRNYAPIVPHAIGTMVYGDDHDPEVRERSIESGEVMARGAALAGGSFFALRRDDGIISDGTARELRAFEATYAARRLLGLERVLIPWETILAATQDVQSIHLDDDKMHSQHVAWIGTFPRFLDEFTTRDDWQTWELHHGYASLGAKGDR
jgi:hypothetical protein